MTVKVMELFQELKRMGWDAEVVVSINGVEHDVLEFREAVLPRSRAVLVAHPSDHGPPNRRARRDG